MKTSIHKKIDLKICAELLRLLATKDGWTLTASGSSLLAHHGNRQIEFFFSDQPQAALTKSFRAMERKDAGQYRQMGVLVAPTTVEMNELRASQLSKIYPRALFASFDEIQEAAAFIAPKEYAAFFPSFEKPTFSAVEQTKAQGSQPFRAEIIANTLVGNLQSPHYRLTFKAPKLLEVKPPQFIMMDTTPERGYLGSRVIRRDKLRDDLDRTPHPLLKRPFGIYRAFYPRFERDFVKRLILPPSLALALHPCYSDHFDILYKVLPDGIGTRLMTQLKKGDQVNMVGPLGRAYEVRSLRARGVEEVHVIGGGVGMAPLILLVETLRFYSFRVKVFLGIAKLEVIRYRDENARESHPKNRNAFVYIDDLLAVGVEPSDIFISFDNEMPKKTIRGIPQANLYRGLVPHQYQKFLAMNPARDSVMAITCGPDRMMEVVCEIAERENVRLKVLLEKRMGCGLGVCFSCVQQVRRPNGTDEYARICIEGPLFDAKDILWKNNDSKQTSVSCACAVRS